MDWKTPKRENTTAVSLPKRWLFIHYYEALNILFRTENALRVFVYIILKSKLADEWSGATIQIAENEHSTIANVAARRIAQARGFGYLGYEIASPLMHLNSGELTRLIMAKAYWPHFEPYFKGKKEIIQAKLDEVNTVRNALAHFRPIRAEDIELIKQNVRHVFAGIEECLTAILVTSHNVPTNSREPWYASLKELSSNLCKLSLFQSENEQWARIRLHYGPPINSEGYSWDGYKSFSVTNLITPAIPKHYPALAKRCIFITESVHVDTDALHFHKHVSFVIGRDVLRTHYQEIKCELEKVLATIDEETALVSADNLARGQLITLAHPSMQKKADQDWWSANTNAMKYAFTENDSPEYWADIEFPDLGDFIASTPKYPWMPVSVAEGETWFDV
jgi:hypothetical protein